MNKDRRLRAGKLIKAAREKAGLTQADLAAILYRSGTDGIRAIENGRRSLTRSEAKDMADALKIPKALLEMVSSFPTKTERKEAMLDSFVFKSIQSLTNMPGVQLSFEFICSVIIDDGPKGVTVPYKDMRYFRDIDNYCEFKSDGVYAGKIDCVKTYSKGVLICECGYGEFLKILSAISCQTVSAFMSGTPSDSKELPLPGGEFFFEMH